MHEEEMRKILVYLKGFTEEERTRLAQITALWLAAGQIPATILPVLIQVNINIEKPVYRHWTLKRLNKGIFVVSDEIITIEMHVYDLSSTDLKFNSS